MGKVNKLRQKYHLSLKKSKSLSNLSQPNQETDIKEKLNLFKSNENIFAGVNISYDDLAKSLPTDLDARSVISTKSRKELKEEEKHLKKKDRQKLRRERFLNKLEYSHQEIRKLKLKKNKEKKPYNNMNSLLEALPSLESIDNDPPKKKFEKSKSKPKKGILKAKQLKRQQSNDSKIFKKILDNKKFQLNPFDTVSEFIKQKVSYETFQKH